MLAKVNTTKRDIETGKKTNPQKCAFAKAFIRAVRKLGWETATVGTSSASLFKTKYDADKDNYDNHPPSFHVNLIQNGNRIVYDFISGFDCGREVKPFTVELDLPLATDTVLAEDGSNRWVSIPKADAQA